MSQSSLLRSIAAQNVYAANILDRRLFDDSSLWNLPRPYVPIDPDPMPPSPYNYAPQVVSWGMNGLWFAKPTDPPALIYPFNGQLGDSTRGTVSYGEPFEVAHWPADAAAARSGDGWLCIVVGDEVFSFIQFSDDGTTKRARNVAYGSVTGSGWGKPGTTRVGLCAAGSSMAAGLMRTKDMANTTVPFDYALRMNVGYQVAKAGPVFPAYTQDYNWQAYTGRWPLGGLVMIDPAFNVGQIDRPLLRKAALTMQTRGAFIVDTCDYTPWQLCGERDSGFDMNYENRDDLAKLTGAMRLCQL